MKKLLIIIGIVTLVILLLGGAWWYLLMNGAPESLSSIPNPFSFGDDAAEEFGASPKTDLVIDQPRASGMLRKISTSPVAGAVVFSRDGATHVRYVERGTGHVFEFDPAAGSTARITGTTIPRAVSAVWSPQGSRVVLVTEIASGEQRIFAAAIERTDEGEGTLATIELESDARNIAFAATGESVYYTVPSARGSVGYEHNLKTNVRSVRFTSVLRDMVVTWEPTLVAYTTPTAHFDGYAYEGTGFTRLFGGANGLMIESAAQYRIVSYAENNSLISRVDTLNGATLGIPVFPEKCAPDSTRDTVLWCAAPFGLAPGAYPDMWYQGAASFDDSIWRLDVEAGSATLVSIPSDDVGEAIDATDMQISSIGDMLLFINKKDGMLWLRSGLRDGLQPDIEETLQETGSTTEQTIP